MTGSIQRLITLAAVAMLLLLTAACGSTGETNDSGSSTSQPTATTSSSGAATPSGASGSSSSSGSSGSGTVYKVGVVFPVSGPNAFVGEENINAIKLAVEEVNASGRLPNGGKLELVIRDDESTPNVGVSAVQRLINEDKVIAILGPFNSNVAAAVAPIANEAEVPMLVAGATADPLTEQGYRYFFRANDNNRQQGTFFMQFVTNQLQWKRVVMIHQQTDWGDGLAQLVREAVEDSGGTVVDTLSYTPGTTNFLSLVTRLSGLEFDGVVTAALNDEMAPLLRQATQTGISGDRFAAFGIDPAELVRLVGDAANGVYIASYFDPVAPQNEVAERFVEQYEAAYGRLPTAFAGQAYNATTMLVAAIEKAGSYDPKEIGAALHELEDVPSVFGPLTFDDNGQAAHPVIVQQIQDGTAKAIGTS